jgi:DNA-binding MarR family transcriptional regulator
MRSNSAKNQKLKASEFTDHIGYWLRLVSNSVSSAFARRLENSGVTVAEWVILREMYGGEGATSPSAVAELTGLTRGAVSKLITRLLDKGYVMRKEAVEDRRYQDIELTSKANALVPRLAGLADENDEEFFSGLTGIEQKQLKGLLRKLASHHQLKTIPIE